MNAKVKYFETVNVDNIVEFKEAVLADLQLGEQECNDEQLSALASMINESMISKGDWHYPVGLRNLRVDSNVISCETVREGRVQGIFRGSVEVNFEKDGRRMYVTVDLPWEAQSGCNFSLNVSGRERVRGVAGIKSFLKSNPKAANSLKQRAIDLLEWATADTSSCRRHALQTVKASRRTLELLKK